MKHSATYKAAPNFFRHNMAFTSTPSIPYRQRSITGLKEFYFNKGPAPYPVTLSVAVGIGKDPTIDFEDVKRISPEELEFAFVEAIYEAITAGAGDSLSEQRP